MALWKLPVDIQDLNNHSKNTAVEHLGIEVTEVGEDFVRGTMPVDSRTHQPMGLLHGGVSCVLAETLGSTAASLACPEGFFPVGIEINASHLRGVRKGIVEGIAKPVRVGRSLQVWQIDISDENGRLVCSSRLSCSVQKIPAS